MKINSVSYNVNSPFRGIKISSKQNDNTGENSIERNVQQVILDSWKQKLDEEVQKQNSISAKDLRQLNMAINAKYNIETPEKEKYEHGNYLNAGIFNSGKKVYLEKQDEFNEQTDLRKDKLAISDEMLKL